MCMQNASFQNSRKEVVCLLQLYMTDWQWFFCWVAIKIIVFCNVNTPLQVFMTVFHRFDVLQALKLHLHHYLVVLKKHGPTYKRW